MSNVHGCKGADLSEVDKVYSAVSAHMSVKERIYYCAQLIYRTHTYLSRGGNQLTRAARNKSLCVLQHAREELSQLLKKGKNEKK